MKLKITAIPRVADRGVQCMMAGYALDHDGDCYIMWDPNTARIHETRDIIWLKRIFYEKEVQAVDIAMNHWNLRLPSQRAGRVLTKRARVTIMSPWTIMMVLAKPLCKMQYDQVGSSNHQACTLY